MSDGISESVRDLENIERNIRELAAMRPHEVPAIVHAPADYKTRRDVVREYISKLRGGGPDHPSVKNQSSGHVIKISVSGLDHFAGYGRTDEKWSLLTHVHLMLRDAQYIRGEKPDARKAGDQNIRAFHKFALPVLLAGHVHLAILTVREDANGRWFYDGGLTAVEMKKPADDYAGHSIGKTPAIQQAIETIAHTIFAVKAPDNSAC